MLETDNYEKFKKDILQLAGIDLNSYKEKQMAAARWRHFCGLTGCRNQLQ